MAFVFRISNMKWALIILMSCIELAMTNVKALNGTIQFDTQSDQQAEMILNEVGLGLGGQPSSNLHVYGNAMITGTLGFGILTVSTNVTLGNQSLVLVDSSSANIDLTLPAASLYTGQIYHIKRMSENDQFVHVLASDNIDGHEGYVDLEAYQALKLVSNGTQWFILNPEGDSLQVTGSANLIGWWKMDDSSNGGILDSSGYGRHGSFVNDARVTNESLELDGSSDYVVVTGFKGVTGTEPRSVSAWVTVDETIIDDAFVSWGTNAASQKSTFRVQQTNGNPGAIRYEVNGGYAVGSTNILDSQWHHVAMTWEDDGTPNVQDTKLYVNGVLESLSTSSSQSINTASGEDFEIGSDHSNRHLDGLLDDVRVYNKALSAEEIQTIYSKGRQ
jgi:hypothetical protein